VAGRLTEGFSTASYAREFAVTAIFRYVPNNVLHTLVGAGLYRIPTADSYGTVPLTFSEEATPVGRDIEI